MTIGPSGSPSPSPSLDAKKTSARSAPVELAAAQSGTPATEDDVVQVGAFKTLVGEYSLVSPSMRGGVPLVVIPAARPASSSPEQSYTTRLMVGGSFAGAMGGAFVVASLVSASPLAGIGLFLGSTALGAAMGFFASRNPHQPLSPPGRQVPPAA